MTKSESDKILKKITVVRKVFEKKNIRCSREESFSSLTTLGCGGKISLTVYPNNLAQLIFVVRRLVRKKIPHLFLGHGSNILASDRQYFGTVVVTCGAKRIAVDGQTVVADCGVSTSKLCSELLKNRLTGGEFFGCLPATVGGAVVCNAGCFNQCVSQVVKSVTVLYRGRVRHYTKKHCRFEKRNSIFKNNGDFLVLKAKMMFPKASAKHIRETLDGMRKKKAETQPLNYRSAGSVLYSDKAAVSFLADRAGLKGFRIGDAAVSEKHAGFVINLDKATAKDIYLVIQYVKNTVKEKFGVSAKTELCLVNFDEPRNNDE